MLVDQIGYKPAFSECSTGRWTGYFPSFPASKKVTSGLIPNARLSEYQTIKGQSDSASIIQNLDSQELKVWDV
ncbi:MAG: hypothetical protein GY754_43830 [bacterium]|nr:hypothetical protein [bacterium]